MDRKTVILGLRRAGLTYRQIKAKLGISLGTIGYYCNTKKFNAQVKEYHLKRNFGISFETYSKMLKDQKGLCAICSRPEQMKDTRNGKVKLLSVDHDHNTGKVRALLCSSCNLALGRLEPVLPKVVEYLQKYS